MKTEKLKLEHLVPYLLYELKLRKSNGTIYQLGIDAGLDDVININQVLIWNNFYDKSIAPVLRPLSDLNYDENPDLFDEIWSINGDFMTDGADFKDINSIQAECEIIPFMDWVSMYNWLLKHHFDVFGLIDSGLAIDINALNQE